MNIVFDLDGTLIDPRLRLYSLFQHLVPASRMTFDEYRQLRQANFSNEMILSRRFGYDATGIGRFTADWMGLIESPEFLTLDSAITGVRDNLAVLRERATLYVCTARQHAPPVWRQLECLELHHFFAQILVTGRRHSKEHLIRENLRHRSGDDWVLGDTGEDIRTGKSLDMKTCAVLSGFSSRSHLLSYNPDLLLDSAAEFA